MLPQKFVSHELWFHDPSFLSGELLTTPFSIVDVPQSRRKSKSSLLTLSHGSRLLVGRWTPLLEFWMEVEEIRQLICRGAAASRGSSAAVLANGLVW